MRRTNNAATHANSAGGRSALSNRAHRRLCRFSLTRALKIDIRQLFKRNILDSLGCAIAGLQGRPFQALSEQFEEYRAPGRCTMIGRGKTSADQAALFNSSLVRYVDLLDSYMAIGGLCHPSDNFGTILAAAEQVGRQARNSCWRSP